MTGCGWGATTVRTVMIAQESTTCHCLLPPSLLPLRAHRLLLFADELHEALSITHRPPSPALPQLTGCCCSPMSCMKRCLLRTVRVGGSASRRRDPARLDNRLQGGGRGRRDKEVLLWDH